MSTFKKHHEAVLVMGSRGLAPSVRSLAFNSAWSKLYRADDYYLDMSVQPEDQSARLQGQLLSDKSERSLAGDIRLYFGDGAGEERAARRTRRLQLGSRPGRRVSPGG